MPRAWEWLTVGIAALIGLYLLVAYVILPDLWKHFEHQPGLQPKPLVTTTGSGIPGDPINVGLVGSKAEIVKAFAIAGWHPADATTVRSSVEIGLSVLLDRPYPDAPVSPLLYEGRRQDLAFEQAVGGSADRRHHVRFWLTLDSGAEGRPVWLGSASFDEGVGLSHDTGQITHHIAPDVDGERDLIMHDLSRAGVLSSIYQVSGMGPTLAGRNGGGDPYFTDGEVSIGVLHVGAEAHLEPAMQRPSASTAINVKQRLWPLVRRLISRL